MNLKNSFKNGIEQILKGDRLSTVVHVISFSGLDPHSPGKNLNFLDKIYQSIDF